MAEVVTSIRHVNDIVGEISAASAEQSAGVHQMGEAMTQMDQNTQQNAALVEQSAAAASSLQTQAEQLVQAVSVFRLAHYAASSLALPAAAAQAPSPVSASAPQRRALTAPASKGLAQHADNWENF